jgi:hypothetical protein
MIRPVVQEYFLETWQCLSCAGPAFMTHVLQQAACLARCNGAMAELVRYDSLSEKKFRAIVQEISASDQQHVIVSYSRKQFLQTG